VPKERRKASERNASEMNTFN